MNTKNDQKTNTEICDKHKIEKKEVSIKNTSIKFFVCDKCNEEYEQLKKVGEEKEKRDRETAQKLDGIPVRFINSDLNQFTNIEPILNWIEKPEGFVFVHGKCGCGKTHLAAAIKKHFNFKRRACFLEFSSNLFVTLRNTFKNDTYDTEKSIIDRYAPEPKNIYAKEQHLGIFDDIGAQKISDFVVEAWYNIIDKRYLYDYATIFTSNLSIKEISALMSDRIASRLASGIVFEMTGNDRRIENKTKIIQS